MAHRASSPPSVASAVVTISDTRTVDTDTSGNAICDLLTAAGHRIVARRLVRDEPGEVRSALESLLSDLAIEAVITTGGTGVSSRDSTYEAIAGMLDKQLPGFGELFRMLSFDEIGAAAMLSRATAGVARGKVVVALPGSEAAVRLAVTRLLVPELAHLVREASR